MSAALQRYMRTWKGTPSLTLHEPHRRKTIMLVHQWRLLRFWCSDHWNVRGEWKHIGKKTCSVTIVIFVRTGRQDWTQSEITSENSYSFMIFQPGVQQTVFDSQQLQRTFWLSRTLPSNFFSTKRVAKNSESKAPSANEGGIQIEKKKQGDTRGTIFSTFLLFKPTSQRG